MPFGGFVLSLADMKRHRFIGSFSFTSDTFVVQDPELVHQWTRVLRLQPNDEVILSDGTGKEARCAVVAVEKKRVSLRILEQMRNEREPERAVSLFCAVLKRENFELVVQKATEIGVKEIVPILTKRTVKLQTKTERLQKIAQEAAEQSGRAIIPVIHEPMTFAQAMTLAGENTMNLFFDLSPDALDTKKIIAKTQKRIGVFIGPEGGWDETEIAVAKQAGFRSASLGALTLRAETAAIVASYLIVTI